MRDPIENKVFQWDQSRDNKFSDINRKINHLDKRLFFDYEPTLGPQSNFLTRLSMWLDNFQDEKDQQILFEMVPHLFYVGREEFNVLYREAYNTHYARWAVEVANIDIYSEDARKSLDLVVEETWFCPLTDSLRINQFYHVNNVSGKNDYRPDWRSLVMFGDDEKIKNYVQVNNIKNIVLLEDFIGNGGQVSKAVNLAIRLFPDINLLIIPLIICPNGMKNAQELVNKYPNVSISPVISMPEHNFINEDLKGDQTDFFLDAFDLAQRSYQQVANSIVIDDKIDPYGPFGWQRTGGMIITYSNTPNNTLPLIHNVSNTWFPLFKRHKRV